MPLLSQYNGTLWGPHTVRTIAMHGGLYLEYIIIRFGGPHIALIIALHNGL
jgi:hypothetical protein